jgi:branched-chain amino acid transport system substrate-binding protein
MNKKSLIIAFILLLAVIIGFWVWKKQNKSIDANTKIKVGVVAPFTGDNAKYGDILKKSFDLAFSTDTSIQIIYEDSKFDPKTSVTALSKLIFTDKAQFVLGEVASGNTMAIAPIAEQNKVILFSTISSTDNLQKAGDYFFRNIPRNDIQGKTVAEFIYSKLNIMDVAVFGQNSEYGNNISKSFNNTFTALGGKVVFTDSYLEGPKDFKTTLIKIKNSGAKALFIPGNINEPAIILKQAKELNLNIPILGGDGSNTDDLIKQASNSSEGFYCTNVLVNKESEFYKEYAKLFTAKYGKEPGAYDAYCYEGAKILLEAIKNSNGDVNKVKEYLYNHTFKSMTGNLKFDADGEVNRLWGMYKVINGKFEEVK